MTDKGSFPRQQCRVTVDEVGASWPGWLTETEVGYVANGRTLMSARADGATAPRAVVSSDRQIATWSKGPEGIHATVQTVW